MNGFPNEKNAYNNNNQKNENSLKPIENKQNYYKMQENNYNPNNNKLKFIENDDQKTLFSTFTGSTNFSKELKNSPLKKTHYNIGEINSKYAAKDKNSMNFSNNDVNFFLLID